MIINIDVHKVDNKYSWSENKVYVLLNDDKEIDLCRQSLVEYESRKNLQEYEIQGMWGRLQGLDIDERPPCH